MRAFSYAWSLPVTKQRYGRHTSRTAVVKNPMLHANFMVLCFIETELLPIEVLHCGNRNFRPFWFLWPWLWYDDLHIRTWPVVRGDILPVQKWTSDVHAFESYRLTHIHTYRQTDRQTNRTEIIHNAASQVVKNLPFISKCKAHRSWHT